MKFTDIQTQKKYEAIKPIIALVRTDITAFKNIGKKPYWSRNPLTQELLELHLSGDVARGVCPIKEGESTTSVGLYDLDSHMRAAMDTEIEVTSSNGYGKATITKQKDGQTGRSFAFKLKPIMFGQDEDGESITSCVLEHLDNSISISKAKKPKGIHQKTLCNLLFTSNKKGGEEIPYETLITDFIKITPHDSKRGLDRRRELGKTAINSLSLNNLIKINDNMVSLT